MKKITIKIGSTVAETFEDFILSRKAKGLSDKTLTTYNQHFKAVGWHIDVDIPIDDLTKTDLESRSCVFCIPFISVFALFHCHRMCSR